MKIKHLVIILFLGLTFYCSLLSRADTVELYSGHIVQGSIIDKGEQSITIDTGIGFPVEIFISNVFQFNQVEQSNLLEELNAQDETVREYKNYQEKVQAEQRESAKLNETQDGGEFDQKKSRSQAEEDNKEYEEDGSKIIANFEAVISADAAEEAMNQILDQMKEAEKESLNEEIESEEFLLEDDILDLDDENKSKATVLLNVIVEEDEEDIKEKDRLSRIIKNAKEVTGLITKSVVGEDALKQQEAKKSFLEKYPTSYGSIISSISYIKKHIDKSEHPVFYTAGLTVIFIAFYIFYCLCFMKIAMEFQQKHLWMAWVPILQEVLLIRMIGKNFWLLLFYLVPILQFIIPIYLWMVTAELLGKTKWYAVLTIVPILNLWFLWYLAYGE